MPTTAAAMARTLSIVLTAAAAGAELRTIAGREAAGGTAATGRGAAVGTGAAGALVTVTPAAGAAAETDEAGAADAGAGILIVGAAVGFGGRLMRTVSFLGCTFAASAGLGGTAPGGGVGIGSAIILVW